MANQEGQERELNDLELGEDDGPTNHWPLVAAVTILLLFGFAVLALFGAPQKAFSQVITRTEEPSLQRTIVCGNFGSPSIVAGSPEALNGGSLLFEDGYTLAVTGSTSFFKHRYGLFRMDGQRISGYALINDLAYHPCPQP